MAAIVAGMFDTIDEARAVGRALVNERFSEDCIDIFFNNPAGRHDRYPIGGDEPADPGAEPAHRSAAAGAAAGAATGAALAAGAGLAGAVAGPAALAVAAVGAYTGALVGAMGGTREARPRRSGMFVAVRADNADRQERAVQVLGHFGGQDIELAEGEWREGQWADFDPTSPPHLVATSGGEVGGEVTPAEGEGATVAESDMVVFRVMPTAGGSWTVTEIDFKKPLSGFATREEAENYAVSEAIAKPRATVEVFREGGQMEFSRAYADGQPSGPPPLPAAPLRTDARH